MGNFEEREITSIATVRLERLITERCSCQGSLNIGMRGPVMLADLSSCDRKVVRLERSL